MPSRRTKAELRRARGRRRRRLRRIAAAVVVLLGALVLLALLALPFRQAPGEAEAARAALASAQEALAREDVPAARDAVGRARTHADALQDAVQGVGGDVWSVVPVAGGPVRDVRHLGNALHELVAIAETGIRVAPQVHGRKATLVDEGNVDLDTLARVTDELDDVSHRLDRALLELDQVGDERPYVGTRLSEARDEALAQMEPLRSGMEVLDPLLEDLPFMLGTSEDRQYLVALLNPAEQRFSGGTPLTYLTVGFDEGRLSTSEAIDPSIARGAAQDIYWKKVKGNPFHRGRLKIVTATMAPDWAISGNELANGWRSLRGRRLSGVVVIDVVALADLISLTGPLEAPVLGTLTGDNLVEKLVGSYDQYPEPSQRKAVNRALAPVFTERLLSGADPVEIGKVLADAADERRFAVFLRDPGEQAAFDAMGLTGTLGPADRDYLGVFTQNRVPSKSDFWHRRQVRSDVQVREDGSADVRLTVSMHNDSPPYLQEEPDPRDGYFTRWNYVSLLTVLPEEAEFVSGTLDGRPFPIQRGNFYGRTFQRHNVDLRPQARREMVIDYRVPSIADVGQEGTLSYGLALDPHALVHPQAVEVRVQFPQGYEVEDLPREWRGRGSRTAVFTTPALETSEFFEVEARP